MDEPPGDAKRAQGAGPARLWPSLPGVVFFAWWAIDEPIFGNALIDILLYLAIGLAGIGVFIVVFRMLNSASKAEALARGEKLTAAQWLAYAAAMTTAGIAVFAAVRFLAAVF